MINDGEDDFARLAELLRKIAVKYGRPHELTDENLAEALTEACRVSKNSATLHQAIGDRQSIVTCIVTENRGWPALRGLARAGLASVSSMEGRLRWQ